VRSFLWSASNVLLPLFPLDTVLFPGMSLPLRVFEHRYRMMMSDCIGLSLPFGIALIKEGQEVGGPAVPYSIGTTTHALNVERHPDGTMDLLAKGERRFEIEEITQQRPYMIARVRILPEVPGENWTPIIAPMSKEFDAYVRVLMAIAGGWRRDLPVPTEPISLSWAIAQTLVNETPETRQRILEAPTAAERLEMERTMLREATLRARATLRERMPPETHRN
jgi:Lon protease-like protein